jgi:hypothetical protein
MKEIIARQRFQAMLNFQPFDRFPVTKESNAMVAVKTQGKTD